MNPELVTDKKGEKLLVDVSGQVTPDELALLQEAGDEVGLKVIQVSTLLSSSGTVIEIGEEKVAYRIQTNDIGLKNSFDIKLAELRQTRS